jgi:hypothetical protein
VEGIFNEETVTLAKDENIIQIKVENIIWQKERLINHALNFIPKECTKFVWCDCDILFTNPDWLVETSALLEKYNIVQPFESAIRLPRGANYFSDSGYRSSSFAKVAFNHPNIMIDGNFNYHGHTGFAWASKVELFKSSGLYDSCIGGCGDHLMAHAFCGDWDSKCVHTIIGQNQQYYKHYTSWCRAIYPRIKASVTFVNGCILHLWHGEFKNRKYTSIDKSLELAKFNPYTDIVIGENGVWQWNTQNYKLIEVVANHFQDRKEDG